MSSSIRQLLRFGPFELDRAARTLRRDGGLVPLPPKAFDLLVVLLESHGAVVDKSTLMQRLWPDTFVEEGNLPVTVFALRKALGEPADQYIRTVPRRGYCFAEPVTVVDEQAGFAPVAVVPPAAAVVPSAPAQKGVEPAATDSGDVDRALAPRPVAPPVPVRRRPRWHALLAVASAAVLAGAAVFVWQTRQVSANLASVQSMAVLPFIASGGTVQQEADSVGAGLAASIANALVGLDDVIVRPFASGAKYGGPSQDALDAGQALRVDAVLKGTVRFLGDTTQVTTTLVRVTDGAKLWSYTTTGPAAELARADVDIVSRLAAALEPGRTGTADAPAARHLPRGDAYDAYLRARDASGAWTARDIQRAVTYFDDAVQRDPGFADAHAGLAALLVLPPTNALSPAVIARAKASAARALAVNPGLSEAQSAWGRAVLLGEWDWAASARAFQAGIAVAPYDIEPHLWYAHWLSAQGRHDEALAEVRLAQDIDPTSPRVNLYVGTLLLAARRYEEGAAQLRKTPLEMGVVNQQVYLATAVAYAKRQQWDEALAVAGRLSRSQPGGPGRAYLAYVLAESGRAAEADAVLEELDRQTDTPRTPHIVLAAAYACRGRLDDAFVRLDKAFEERDPRVMFLKVDPMLDCARSDARFAAAVRRIGLEP